MGPTFTDEDKLIDLEDALKLVECNVEELKLVSKINSNLRFKILQDSVNSEKSHVEVMKILLENNFKFKNDILNKLVNSDQYNTEVIKLLLDYGVELYDDILRDIVSSKRCNIEVLKLLLERGAKLHHLILHDAMRNGGCNVEVVKLLLKSGADITRDILNDTVKLKDCKCEVIQLLIKSGAEINPRVLVDAVLSESCDLNVIKTLLKSGAYIKRSILYVALLSDGYNFDVIKYLLKKGAYITSKLLNYAVLSKGCCIELIKLLREYGASFDPWLIHDAIYSKVCSLEVIKFLIRSEPQLTNDLLKNALSAENCSKNELKVFLENRDSPKSFILGTALRTNDIILIKLLVKNGAQFYKDILSEAVYLSVCSYELIKFLIESKADIATDVLEYVILSHSAKNNIEVIKLLLENGAKPIHNVHVLSYAATLEQYNFEELIKLFIKYGLELSSDLLNDAVLIGHKFEIVKVLLDNGAELDDKIMYRAIIGRCHNKGDIRVMKLLIKKINYKLPDDLVSNVVKNCNCNFEVIKLLLENDAKFSRNILFEVMSSEECNVAVIKLLLENGAEVSCDIFKSLKIVSSRINECKILLQYYFVQRLRLNFYEIKSPGYFPRLNTLFDLSNCENEIVYQAILVYIKYLLFDLLKMLADNISLDTTLFSFVSNRCSNILVTEKAPESVVKKVLSRFHSAQYIHCSDILLASLSKRDLLDEISMLYIYVKNISVNKSFIERVGLNRDTVLHLISFLSKEDIINLIIAFSHEDEKSYNKRKLKFNEQINPPLRSAKLRRLGY